MFQFRKKENKTFWKIYVYFSNLWSSYYVTLIQWRNLARGSQKMPQTDNWICPPEWIDKRKLKFSNVVPLPWRDGPAILFFILFLQFILFFVWQREFLYSKIFFSKHNNIIVNSICNRHITIIKSQKKGEGGNLCGWNAGSVEKFYSEYCSQEKLWKA